MSSEDLDLLVFDGIFDYGKSIPVYDIAAMFEIDIPKPGDRNNYIVMKTFDLNMLSVYSQVNNKLLQLGRKIIRSGDDYVVPTIGATLLHADRYEEKASKAATKSRILRSSFWKINPDFTSNDDDIKNAKNHGTNNRNFSKDYEPPLN